MLVNYIKIIEKAKMPFGEGSLAEEMENMQGFQVTRYVHTQSEGERLKN